MVYELQWQTEKPPPTHVYYVGLYIQRAGSVGHPPLAGPRNFRNVHTEALVSEDAVGMQFMFKHHATNNIFVLRFEAS